MEDIQHQQMGYDRAATMFAPDGHILQVEYAEKTVRLGSSSIGIIGKDFVLIISDRRQNDPLIVEESANKILEIDDHVMVVSAGIPSDARVLIEKARIIAQQHRVTFDSAPTVEYLVKNICDIKQQFTQYGGARPFGVSLMFGGFDKKPALYTTGVTGNYFQYKANAIGENDEKIKEILRKKYKEGMNLKEAIKLAIEILKEVQKDKFDLKRIDAAFVDKEKKLKRLNFNSLQEYLK